MVYQNFFWGVLVALTLAACGGGSSDDAAQQCSPRHPAIPAGQSYAVTQELDRLNQNGTGRYSEFLAAGSGIPSNAGQLHLTPMDAQSPITQMRAALMEMGECPELSIQTLSRSLRRDETMQTFAPSVNPADPRMLGRYILDGFDYWATGENRVAFHVDTARYPNEEILLPGALNICAMAYNVGTYVTYCPEVSVRREGHLVIAEATLQPASLTHTVVLVSTLPRGVDTVVP